jgi:hypothetical protein
MKFLLDENVDPLYRHELLRREPALVVWKIGDAAVPPVGTKDPEILRWCEAYGFVLVTNNRHSMPQHLRDHVAAGGHLPGIIELNPNLSIGENLNELLLIWGTAQEEEYADRIAFLPVT